MSNHITGKVYDLTQANMNKLIAELEAAKTENDLIRHQLVILVSKNSVMLEEIERLNSGNKKHKAAIKRRRNYIRMIDEENAKLKARVGELEAALQTLLKEISNPTLERLNYSEYQITNGVIESIKQALTKDKP